MSTADGAAFVGGPLATPATQPQASPVAAAAVPASDLDVLKPDNARGRERFIPVTSFALIDRLTAPHAWARARRRPRAASSATSITGAASSTTPRCMSSCRTYEPFSPDSDLLVTRAFSRRTSAHVMQKRVVEQASSAS